MTKSGVLLGVLVLFGLYGSPVRADDDGCRAIVGSYTQCERQYEVDGKWFGKPALELSVSRSKAKKAGTFRFRIETREPDYQGLPSVYRHFDVVADGITHEEGGASSDVPHTWTRASCLGSSLSIRVVTEGMTFPGDPPASDDVAFTTVGRDEAGRIVFSTDVIYTNEPETIVKHTAIRCESSQR